MKPGQEEGSIVFEAEEEIGMVLDAVATCSTDEEYRLIWRRLRSANATYELGMPHSEVAINALRQVVERDFYVGMRQKASEILAGYESPGSMHN